MKQVLNQSSLYHANQKINVTSSENNAPNNSQQSFENQTKEFLRNLEDTLKNFLDSFKITLTTLTNVIRAENQAHNEEIKQIIIETIKAQLKNSNSASEESKEQSNRSYLSFTFGQKRSQPLDSKRKKRNAAKNSENNIFFLREAKFGGSGGPLNTRKDPKIMIDEFEQTIRAKLTSDIKHPNYGKSIANFMGTKSYDSFSLGNKHNFIYKKKKFN